MKRHLQSLLFGFLLLSLRSEAQVAKELFESRLPVNLLLNDIDRIDADLEKNHPNVYRYISKKQLSLQFDSLKRSITLPLTRMEFRYKVLTVLQHIGDGHMTLVMNGSKITPQDAKSYFGNRVLPIAQFYYKVVDRKLYIIGNRFTSGNDVPPGSEVVSVNGEPATNVINRMINGLCADGYNTTFKYFTLNTDMFSNVYSNTFGNQDTVEFQLQHLSDSKSVRMHTITSAVNPVRKPAFLIPNFRISPVNNVATITIGSFDNRLRANYQSWFDQLSSSNVKTLILDLRNNKGGEQADVVKLFSFLISAPSFFAKIPRHILNDKLKTPSESMKVGVSNKIAPAKNFFAGKIYLLINGGSFSATAILAANLQAINKDIRIVGEESGGGRDGCTGGVFKNLDLKNSNLSLRYGLVPLRTLNTDRRIGVGVIPDIKIENTIEHSLNGRDVQMEWVQNDLNNK